MSTLALDIQNTPAISIKNLMLRFRWRIIFTIALVLIDSIAGLLFPLFIGFAINGLLEGSIAELINLGLLGGFVLTVGSLRRFFDTRAYAGIYTTISNEMVARERAKEKPLTAIVARANLLTEFVQFLENSMPTIIASLIGVVGVLLIILSLNAPIFVASVALFGLVMLVYVMSGKLNFRFNKGFNDEFENRVDAIASEDETRIDNHFQTMMKWQIRLSDLETFNFIIIWMGSIALLLFAPLSIIESGIVNFGLIFSILTYVFQYIESLATLPLFIQQIIRLQEISTRLNE